MRGREVAALTDWAGTIAEPIARQLNDTAVMADTLSRRDEDMVSRKAIEGLEQGGFARGRVRRLLAQWAEGIGELLERQRAQIMDCMRGLSDPDRNVVMRPGPIARQFGRRRDMEHLDDWGRSLTEWLDLQVRTTRALLTAISKEPLSGGGSPAVEHITQPIAITVEPEEAGPRRKQAGRRRGAKVGSGLEI
jgi:hypothetical protein